MNNILSESRYSFWKKDATSLVTGSYILGEFMTDLFPLKSTINSIFSCQFVVQRKHIICFMSPSYQIVPIDRVCLYFSIAMQQACNFELFFCHLLSTTFNIHNLRYFTKNITYYLLKLSSQDINIIVSGKYYQNFDHFMFVFYLNLS